MAASRQEVPHSDALVTYATRHANEAHEFSRHEQAQPGQRPGVLSRGDPLALNGAHRTDSNRGRGRAVFPHVTMLRVREAGKGARSPRMTG